MSTPNAYLAINKLNKKVNILEKDILEFLKNIAANNIDNSVDVQWRKEWLQDMTDIANNAIATTEEILRLLYEPIGEGKIGRNLDLSNAIYPVIYIALDNTRKYTQVVLDSNLELEQDFYYYFYDLFSCVSDMVMISELGDDWFKNKDYITYMHELDSFINHRSKDMNTTVDYHCTLNELHDEYLTTQIGCPDWVRVTLDSIIEKIFTVEATGTKVYIEDTGKINRTAVEIGLMVAQQITEFAPLTTKAFIRILEHYLSGYEPKGD